MLLDVHAVPVPPSEVTRRLQRLFGDDLTLRWSAYEGCWHVLWTWPPDHRGWAMVQRQEIARDRANDIVARLPKDCPVDQAAAYLERALRTWPTEDVRKLANALTDWNDTQPMQQAADAAVESVLSGDPTQIAPDVAEAAGIRAVRGRKRR